jgi:tetratricopeptide (TPR) repeat protein
VKTCDDTCSAQVGPVSGSYRSSKDDVGAVPFFFAFKYSSALLPIFLSLFSHLLGTTAVAQSTVATITKLERGLKPLRDTSDIKCIRYADVVELPKVEVGMRLSLNDELRGLGSVRLEVTCDSGTPMNFSGPFRVIFITRNGEACGIHLFSGDVNVLSSRSTTVVSGAAKLATKRTQYGMSIRRTGKGYAQDWMVYEGEAEIQVGDFVRTLGAGDKLVIREGQSPLAKRIEQPDISRAADIYARLGVVEGKAIGNEDRQRLYQQFRDLNTAVLSNPKDVEARVLLATAEIERGIYTPAIYHLNLAEGLPKAEYQKALISELKATAFANIGRSDPAREDYAKAPAPTKSVTNPGEVAGVSDGGATSARAANTGSAKSSAAPPSSQKPMAGAGAAAPERAGRSADEQEYLLHLVTLGRYEEAIKGFRRRLGARGPNSADYYGLAISYYGFGDTKQASRFAKQALERNSVDHELSKEQQDAVEKIAAAPIR